MPSTLRLGPQPPDDHDLLGYIHHMAVTAQSLEVRSLFALYLQHEIRCRTTGRGEAAEDVQSAPAFVHGNVE